MRKVTYLPNKINIMEPQAGPDIVYIIKISVHAFDPTIGSKPRITKLRWNILKMLNFSIIYFPHNMV